MSGGGGGPIGQIMSQMNAPAQAPGNPGGVDYTPVATPGHYAAQYGQQSATPFLQSVMAQHSPQMLQNNNNLGLPSLQNMFNMPQHAPQQGMPMPHYMGSTYRPDMSGIMAKLNNVAPAVTYDQMHPVAPVAPAGDGSSSSSGGSGDGGGGDGGGGDGGGGE